MEVATLNVLEEADLPAPQARAIARAIEIECVAQHAPLATKLDIAELRGELNGKIDALRGELLGAIGSQRGELVGAIGSQRGELVRWLFTVMLGHTVILVGAIHFLLER